MSRLRKRNFELDLLRFIVSGFIGFLFFSHVFNTSRITIRRPKVCAMTNSNHNNDVIDKEEAPNDIEQSLYIGMMSTKVNLQTRVEASLNTWLRHIPNNVKIEIFASNDGTLVPSTGAKVTVLKSGIHVIQLPGVPDKTYPPQKKSFSMIKYMHDNYANRFKWFLRLDDDAYVKLDKLVRFLSRVNASKPYFIGQPGFGRDAGDYIGKEENYCMGGPGVIFSQKLLQTVGPQLRNCLGTMYTDHEDVELGRCVTKVTGRYCTNSWDTNEYFFQNYPPKGSKHVVAPNIEYIEPHKREHALTLHSNKIPAQQIKLHKDILTDSLQQLLHKSALLKRDIERINNHINRKSKKRHEMESTKTWNYFHLKLNSHYHVGNIPLAPGNLIVNETMAKLTDVYYRTKRNHHYLIFTRYKGLDKLLYNVNPFIGYDVIATVLQELPRKSGVKSTHQTNFHLRVPFANDNTFMLEDQSISNKVYEFENNKQVTIIVVVNGRSEVLKGFLTNLEHEFLWNNEKINLILSVFRRGDAGIKVKTEDVARDELKKLGKLYPNFRSHLVISEAPFTRGYGLKIGINAVDDPNDLLFLCDVDMMMTRPLLTRIRRNTIKGKQVYFPIIYSEYKQDETWLETYTLDGDVELNERYGFWRISSYGMLSIYKKDYENCRGFDLSIKGWGTEDINLVSALQDSDLQIFRGNEQSLVHAYHEKACDRTLTAIQLHSCVASQKGQIASSIVLSTIWKQNNGYKQHHANML